MQPAVLSACHILESMSEDTLLGDRTTQLFQLNGVHVMPPQNANVQTKDASRMFFATRALTTQAQWCFGVAEEAALQLPGCKDREDFVQQARATSLSFLSWPLSE